MKYYIALSAFALALGGCSSETGLADCSYPATSASFAPTGIGFTGVVTLIRFSSGQNSPGGGPASQVDAIVTAITPLNAAESTHEGVPPGAKYHLVLGGTTPVFAGSGAGAPSASNACELKFGQRVNVWMSSGFGDEVAETQSGSPPMKSYNAIEPLQVEILGGR
jgi:hypothetical protein